MLDTDKERTIKNEVKKYKVDCNNVKDLHEELDEILQKNINVGPKVSVIEVSNFVCTINVLTRAKDRYKFSSVLKINTAHKIFRKQFYDIADTRNI